MGEINLYWVQEIYGEWGVYIFAKLPGLAKSAFQRQYDSIEYLDIRVRLVGKTDKVSKLTVVDHERHPLYPVVLELGGGFTGEGEYL